MLAKISRTGTVSTPAAMAQATRRSSASAHDRTSSRSRGPEIAAAWAHAGEEHAEGFGPPPVTHGAGRGHGMRACLVPYGALDVQEELPIRRNSFCRPPPPSRRPHPRRRLLPQGRNVVPGGRRPIVGTQPSRILSAALARLPLPLQSPEGLAAVIAGRIT